jgi:hypothetical protein
MPLRRERRSPFESPSQMLVGARAIRRGARNWLIVTATIVLWIDLVGEPLLRWEYRYLGDHSAPSILDATYVGVSGRLEASAGEYADGCPLVLFVKPSPPLWRRASDCFVSLVP